LKAQGGARHLVTPRVLLFLQRAGQWLFIEGAPHKWWAGKMNGVGGSVEAGETILEAATRETSEETGLHPEALELAAIIHVSGEPAVLLFVFLGDLPEGELQPCDEGTFHWLSHAALEDSSLSLMPDLPLLLPRLWARQAGDPPLHLLYDFTSGELDVRGG
jgi:ADP-ribose pyrophosphatase YjhB (NUDIX family)